MQLSIKINRFINLSKERKLLFFEVVALSVRRTVLKLLGFKSAYTENLIKKSLTFNPDILSPSQLQDARDIAIAIELGRKYIPWKNLCRHQAWQAVILLQKAGIPFTYHVGIKKEGPNRNEGHAWVMVDGRFISGKCRLSEYREIKF